MEKRCRSLDEIDKDRENLTSFPHHTMWYPTRKDKRCGCYNPKRKKDDRRRNDESPTGPRQTLHAQYFFEEDRNVKRKKQKQ